MALFNNFPKSNLHDFYFDWLIELATTIRKQSEDTETKLEALDTQIELLVEGIINEWLEDGTLKGIMATVLEDDHINIKLPPNDLNACVGDGITDDSANLQAIINYAVSVNKAIYVPSGNYVLGTTINCNSANIYGEGNTSAFTSSATNLTLLNGDNFVISDMAIYGNTLANSKAINSTSSVKLDNVYVSERSSIVANAINCVDCDINSPITTTKIIAVGGKYGDITATANSMIIASEMGKASLSGTDNLFIVRNYDSVHSTEINGIVISDNAKFHNIVATDVSASSVNATDLNVTTVDASTVIASDVNSTNGTFTDLVTAPTVTATNMSATTVTATNLGLPSSEAIPSGTGIPLGDGRHIYTSVSVSAIAEFPFKTNKDFDIKASNSAALNDDGMSMLMQSTDVSVIYFESGTYNFSSPITLNRKVSFVADGEVIFNFEELPTTENPCVILSGDNLLRGIAVTTALTDDFPMITINGTNVKIDNCYINGTNAIAINSSNATITNTNINALKGITVKSNRIRIHNSRFISSTYSDNSYAIGIGTSSYDCMISDNYATGFDMFVNCNSLIALSQTTISNNVVSANTLLKADGIRNMRYVTIDNNVINASANSKQTSRAISISAPTEECNGIRISNNIIYGSGGFGLNIVGSATAYLRAVNIVNNTMYNNGTKLTGNINYKFSYLGQSQLNSNCFALPKEGVTNTISTDHCQMVSIVANHIDHRGTDISQSSNTNMAIANNTTRSI